LLLTGSNNGRATIVSTKGYSYNFKFQITSAMTLYYVICVSLMEGNGTARLENTI